MDADSSDDEAYANLPMMDLSVLKPIGNPKVAAGGPLEVGSDRTLPFQLDPNDPLLQSMREKAENGNKASGVASNRKSSDTERKKASEKASKASARETHASQRRPPQHRTDDDSSSKGSRSPTRSDVQNMLYETDSETERQEDEEMAALNRRPPRGAADDDAMIVSSPDSNAVAAPSPVSITDLMEQRQLQEAMADSDETSVDTDDSEAVAKQEKEFLRNLDDEITAEEEKWFHEYIEAKIAKAEEIDSSDDELTATTEKAKAAKRAAAAAQANRKPEAVVGDKRPNDESMRDSSVQAPKKAKAATDNDKDQDIDQSAAATAPVGSAETSQPSALRYNTGTDSQKQTRPPPAELPKKAKPTSPSTDTAIDSQEPDVLPPAGEEIDTPAASSTESFCLTENFPKYAPDAPSSLLWSYKLFLAYMKKLRREHPQCGVDLDAVKETDQAYHVHFSGNKQVIEETVEEIKCSVENQIHRNACIEMEKSGVEVTVKLTKPLYATTKPVPSFFKSPSIMMLQPRSLSAGLGKALGTIEKVLFVSMEGKRVTTTDGIKEVSQGKSEVTLQVRLPKSFDTSKLNKETLVSQPQSHARDSKASKESVQPKPDPVMSPKKTALKQDATSSFVDTLRMFRKGKLALAKAKSVFVLSFASRKSIGFYSVTSLNQEHCIVVSTDPNGQASLTQNPVLGSVVVSCWYTEGRKHNISDVSTLRKKAADASNLGRTLHVQFKNYISDKAYYQSGDWTATGTYKGAENSGWNGVPQWKPSDEATIRDPKIRNQLLQTGKHVVLLFDSTISLGASASCYIAIEDDSPAVLVMRPNSLQRPFGQALGCDEFVIVKRTNKRDVTTTDEFKQAKGMDPKSLEMELVVQSENVKKINKLFMKPDDKVEEPVPDADVSTEKPSKDGGELCTKSFDTKKPLGLYCATVGSTCVVLSICPIGQAAASGVKPSAIVVKASNSSVEDVKVTGHDHLRTLYMSTKGGSLDLQFDISNLDFTEEDKLQCEREWTGLKYCGPQLFGWDGAIENTKEQETVCASTSDSGAGITIVDDDDDDEVSDTPAPSSLLIPNQDERAVDGVPPSSSSNKPDAQRQKGRVTFSKQVEVRWYRTDCIPTYFLTEENAHKSLDPSPSAPSKRPSATSFREVLDMARTGSVEDLMGILLKLPINSFDDVNELKNVKEQLKLAAPRHSDSKVNVFKFFITLHHTVLQALVLSHWKTFRITCCELELDSSTSMDLEEGRFSLGLKTNEDVEMKILDKGNKTVASVPQSGRHGPAVLFEETKSTITYNLLERHKLAVRARVSMISTSGSDMDLGLIEVPLRRVNEQCIKDSADEMITFAAPEPSSESGLVSLKVKVRRMKDNSVFERKRNHCVEKIRKLLRQIREFRREFKHADWVTNLSVHMRFHQRVSFLHICVLLFEQSIMRKLLDEDADPLMDSDIGTPLSIARKMEEQYATNRGNLEGRQNEWVDRRKAKHLDIINMLQERTKNVSDDAHAFALKPMQLRSRPATPPMGLPLKTCFSGRSQPTRAHRPNKIQAIANGTATDHSGLPVLEGAAAAWLVPESKYRFRCRHWEKNQRCPHAGAVCNYIHVQRPWGELHHKNIESRVNRRMLDMEHVMVISREDSKGKPLFSAGFCVNRSYTTPVQQRAIYAEGGTMGRFNRDYLWWYPSKDDALDMLSATIDFTRYANFKGIKTQRGESRSSGLWKRMCDDGFLQQTKRGSGMYRPWSSTSLYLFQF